MIPGTSKGNSGGSKGKGRSGVPERSKLATYTFKVVSVDVDTRTTPTAAYRVKHLQQLIIEKRCEDTGSPQRTLECSEFVLHVHQR